MHGGSESNVEPGFAALQQLKPNLSAVAANPGALAALYQQRQVDISPGNYNAIQILKAQGVPVEFVAPKEGAIAFRTTMHITKNSANAELAFKLIEAALSPEVQETLMASPTSSCRPTPRSRSPGRSRKPWSRTRRRCAAASCSRTGPGSTNSARRGWSGSTAKCALDGPA